MQKRLALAAFAGTVMLAQTPDLSGVWRANLQKSQLGNGPKPVTYLVIIEQKNAVFNNRTKEEALQITETTGTWGQREERVKLAFFVNNKRKVGAYRGVPTELLGTVENGKVTVKGERAGGGGTFTRVYDLSSDGKTLTETEDSAAAEGPSRHTVVVLDKQDDAAGEPLRKPEELAGAHFKNVKTESLKGLPASEFIDQMQYFSWSLGKNCQFCHVERKFDADDKKEKQNARKMIDMVAAINQHNFEDKPAVRCFTCHSGYGHPLSHQLFADEVQMMKEREAREKAERDAHRPPPPGNGPPPPPPPQR